MTRNEAREIVKIRKLQICAERAGEGPSGEEKKQAVLKEYKKLCEAHNLT